MSSDSGPDNLLRRHDHEVDAWAGTPAAHFLYDYTDVEGFRFPRRRSVFSLKPDGSINYGFNIVTVAMSNYMPGSQEPARRSDLCGVTDESILVVARSRSDGTSSSVPFLRGCEAMSKLMFVYSS